MSDPEQGWVLADPGARYGSGTAVVDPGRARAYAAATNDGNPRYEQGVVPPLFAVVPPWEALMQSVIEIVPEEFLSRLLHGEHDLHLHRPLRAGETLTSHVEVHQLRAARTGTGLTLRVVSEGEGGEVVAEQYATMFLRSLTGVADAGPEKPDHSFPEEARDRPVAEGARSVDEDQTERYAAASGDRNPIHLDPEAARAARLPGIVLHGLCTMAMCGAVVVDEVAGGDPTRLARLAVRFSWPVFPGSDLTCSIYRVGSADGIDVYAFEAGSRGKVVVRDGRAEVRVR